VFDHQVIHDHLDMFFARRKTLAAPIVVAHPVAGIHKRIVGARAD
jgi:hypothetical protein